jgi:hypothetical protein
MAEAQNAAGEGKKRRKASGPRTARPIFAVVSYRDEQGQAVQLDKARLTIKLERDAGKLVELVTNPENAGGVTVVKADMPEPTQRAAAPAA